MTDTADPFTEDEKRALAALAGMIVPASDKYGVPGADDPAIVAGILSDAARRPARLSAALSALDGLARETHDSAFADLDAVRRHDVVESFRDAHGPDADYVAALTVTAYYRDDRVVRSLGMELRPPHPQGYEVAQGDWSLLDPVRGREPFFRST